MNSLTKEIKRFCNEDIGIEFKYEEDFERGFNLFAELLNIDEMFRVDLSFKDKILLELVFESDKDELIFLKLMDDMVVNWYSKCSDDFKNYFNFKIEVENEK